MSEENVRATRSARPMMSIPLPPKFEFNAGMEDEFLTPPIWVASNPPPMFERTEMKRTMSEVSSWGGDEDDEESVTSSESQEKEQEEEEAQVVTLQRPVRLQERRSQTFSNSTLRPPMRPSYKRRISDSVATRTRARLLAQQAFSSSIAPAEEEPVPSYNSREIVGERKPVITANALTMYFLNGSHADSRLTLARSSSNPYSPPIDHEKFANAGLPLASPFHEKKSFFDAPRIGSEKPIKKFFGVTKGSKKDKEVKEIKSKDGMNKLIV